jgi:hypothetical protein
MSSAPKHKLRVPRAKRGAVRLLIGTRKGAFRIKSDKERKSWQIDKVWNLGQTVHHVVQDPRDANVTLIAARTGHLGPTLFRSIDGGKTFKEAKTPPAFDKASDGLSQRTVNHTFWLTPGNDADANVWYAGTSPQGLFKSRDGGRTWKPVAGLNSNPMLDEWTGGDKDGTPDGPKLHSICVDSRDSDHMYIGMSGGGVFELAAIEQRLRCGLLAEQGSGVWARSALHGAGGDQPGSALAAEPLRYLSHGPRGR